MTFLIGAGMFPAEARRHANLIPGLGIKGFNISVHWSHVKPTADGPYNWDLPDEAFELAQELELLPEVHIHCQSDWACPPPPADIPLPPGSEGTSTFPYSPEDYQEFIYTFVSRYAGRCAGWACENEVAAPSFWASSIGAYIQLLTLFRVAVKAADATAVVLNDGIASGSLCAAVARRYYDAGEPDMAIDFLNDAFALHWPAALTGAWEPIRTPRELGAFLNSPGALRTDAYMAAIAANPGLYDHFQAHWYQPARLLPVAVDCIRAAGIQHPLEWLELAYGWNQSLGMHDLQEQARETARLLVTAVGEGSVFTHLWRLTTVLEKMGRPIPGMIDEGRPRPALDAFALTVEQLSDVAVPTGARLGDTVDQIYRFSRGPKRSLFVAWTSDVAHRISLPTKKRSANAINLDRAHYRVDPHALPLTGSPIFVEA